MTPFKTAFRYSFSKARGQRLSTMINISGLMLGLSALITIISVMNGLGNMQLQTIRDLMTFDIVIKSGDIPLDEIRKIEKVEDAFLFSEAPAVIVDKTTGKSTAVILRGYDENYMKSKRVYSSAKFADICSDDEVQFSRILANAIVFIQGDSLELIQLVKGKTATAVPARRSVNFKGFFNSSLTEFNSNVVVGALDKENVCVGIFTDDTVYVKECIRKNNSDIEIVDWKQANMSLYSALLLEKVLVYIFLGFIFLVICINLKNSTGRLVLKKQAECAVMRAMGCSKQFIFMQFFIQGLLICGTGIVTGTLLGITLSENVNFVLHFAGNVFNKPELNFIILPVIVSVKEIVITDIVIALITAVFIFTASKKINGLQITEAIKNAGH
ncbi:MAG: FtsX-like permease family protein [Sphaerochaetaceae bacterium]|nr:FtsX-like permease family protein [Sphaerochaetaceae bacterium]